MDMRRTLEPRALVFVAALLIATAASAATGVVVEKALAGHAASRAGIREGDLLLGWYLEEKDPSSRQQTVEGTFRTPFDLSEVEREEASRRSVTIHGLREGQPFAVELAVGSWGLEARPWLSADDLEAARESEQLLARGEVDAGLTLWRRQREKLRQESRHLLAAWQACRISTLLQQQQRCEKARAEMEAGVGDAEAAHDPRTTAAVKERLAALLSQQGALTAAAELYRHVLVERRALQQPLGVAETLERLARLSLHRGALDEARELLDQALQIAEREAADSLIVAEILSSLAVVLGRRSEMDGAVSCLRRALEIQERLAPGSRDVVTTLNRLGLAARQSGDLAAAEQHYHDALEIARQLDSQGRGEARILANLGVLASKRGDLVLAEKHFWRALELLQRIEPESLAIAGCLTNLGDVFADRGDLEGAEPYFRRALAISERLVPDGLDLGNILTSFGNLMLERGELTAAREHFQRAHELRERAIPTSSWVAESLRDLGRVELRSGELAVAEKFLRRALAIESAATPGSLDLAGTLDELGRLAAMKGELEAAAEHHHAALAIRSRLAPGTLAEAATLRHLASLRRAQGDLAAAEAFYARAIAALEAQEHRLGGSYEARSRFAASQAAIYAEGIDLLVELGKVTEAFYLLERSRSRAFLGLLEQRGLSFAADLSPQLEARRRRADAHYDAVLGRLAQLSDADNATAAAGLHRELDEARREQAAVKARIRLASPRLSALHYPEPLDLAATRKALSPGTLLLSFALGEERGHLFAVGPGHETVRVVPLLVGKEALRQEVTRWRALLRPSETPEVIRFRAQQLGELLFGGVADRIERAERLLILPEGPLHALPFAALVVADGKGRYRHLLELKPVTVAASATVFAQLQKGRRGLDEIRLIGFGDPAYPAEPRVAERGSSLRAAFELGLRLDPLPGARAELEVLESLFPATASIFIGNAASEERAKSSAHDGNVFHFACHGVVDDRFPLESALVLSLPASEEGEGENGLLQAWEIFEQIRIDADLVTLSACDTALGEELAGEGMIGLTRAFQYAGARTVLASLWGVSDTSTARLMERFYRGLKQGTAKDEALRQAQLELLRGEAGFAHPFYWAAFKLVGGWR